MTHPVTRDAGMTLVEIAVALFVVSLSVAGLFAVANQSWRAMGGLRDQTRALHIVQSEIERLRVAVPAEAGGPVLPLDVSHRAALALLRDGEGDIRIADVPGKPGLRTVAVTVTWTGRTGIRRQVSLSTMVNTEEKASR